MPFVAQAAHYLQRTEHTHDSVEPPPCLHGVYVRPQHENRAGSAPDPPNEVTRRVDMRIEARVAEA